MASRFIFATAAFSTLFTSWTNAVDKDHDQMSSSCRQSDCLRCDLGSSQCVKCIHVMMVDTRTCLHKCPHGFEPIWAEERHVFGRICQERSVLAMISYREVGIIAGASVLGAICVGVFLGVLLLRRKGVKSTPDSPLRGLPRSLQDKRPKTAEVVVKGKERAEFLSRLRALRTDAPYIFRMMAAMRNRFRSGSAASHEVPSDAKTKACKVVVRDLSRVLCLLSLKEEHLQTAPKDWRCLLSWTERLLARYKRQEEIKAMGEGFGDPLKNANGYPGATRTLFVTRQQQLKAEQEKRRLEAKTSILGKDTEDDLESFPKDSEEEPTPRPLSPLHLDCKDIYDANELIIPKEPPKNSHDDFIPNDLLLKKILEPKQNKPLSGKGNKKTIKEFLSLNKILWLRLLSLRGTVESDLEKGSEKVIISPTSPSIENYDDFSLGADDISSEIFFDHIEAFAFDLENITNQNREQKFESNEVNREASSNPDCLLSTNKNYKSNLDLYKNYKNSRLLSGVRPTFSPTGDYAELHQNQKQSGHYGVKEKRPGRLRRLSSSILMKDKMSLALTRREAHSRPKKRRPLKRQKQVEKEKRSKIQEKYQNKSFRQDPSIVCEDHRSTVEVLNTSINQNNESDDVYLSVIKTPVPRRSSSRRMVNVSSSHYKAILELEFSSKSILSTFDAKEFIQQSEDSKIKIMVPSMDHARCDPEHSVNQNVACDTRHLKNLYPYPKCEVLTDV